MNHEHYDEMTCVLYLDGQLDAGRAKELETHTAQCHSCRALLNALKRESLLLHDALTEADEAVPARVLAPRSRERTPWAWILSLGFAGAGAYTLWTGTIEPWLGQLGRAGFGQTDLLTLLFFGGAFRGAFWEGWGDMFKLLEILGAITIGALALWAFRRTARRWTTVGLVFGALLALLSLPSTAAAAEVRKGEGSYTLPKDQTVKNDLVVAGGTIRIEGTVEGDLIVFCQSLTVSGKVGGDILGFAQSIRIPGEVEGDVRAFNKNLTVTGTIRRSLTAFGESLEIDPDGQVGGGVMAFGSQLTLDGRIQRDAMLFGNRQSVNGRVGGNLQSHGMQLFIGGSAEIGGKASFKGRKQPQVDPQAKLASPLEVEIISSVPNYLSGRFYWRQALRWATAFIFGLVLVLIMPGFFGHIAESCRNPASAVGLLVLPGLPFLALLGCLTFVGLAVGLTTLGLWVVMLYAAQVFVATAIAELLFGKAPGTGALLGRLAIGLLILRVLFNVPNSWFTTILWIAVTAWGIGGLTVAIFTRPKPAAAAPLEPAPAI